MASDLQRDLQPEKSTSFWNPAMQKKAKVTPAYPPYGIRHYCLEIGADDFERAMQSDQTGAVAMIGALSLTTATVFTGVANVGGQLGLEHVVFGLAVGSLGLFALALVRAHKRADSLERAMFQAAVDSLHRREAHTLGAFDRIRRLAMRS